MTNEEIDKAIEGWTGVKLPYSSCLNAVHELENYVDYSKYVEELKVVIRNPSIGNLIHATARQRCEAILRTRWQMEGDPMTNQPPITETQLVDLLAAHERAKHSTLWREGAKLHESISRIESLLEEHNALPQLIAEVRRLREAGRAALTALDSLMGDTDLDSDDSLELKACQLLSACLSPSANQTKRQLTGAKEVEK